MHDVRIVIFNVRLETQHDPFNELTRVSLRQGSISSSHHVCHIAMDIRQNSRCNTSAKQVHYSNEWFTTILLSAPGVQRSFYSVSLPPPSPFSLLSLPRVSPSILEKEKGLKFYFSATHARKRAAAKEGPFGSFHKSRLAHSFS